MPIREYIAVEPEKGCAYCRDGFEQLESMESLPNTVCPRCMGKVKRRISAPRVGRSQSGYDDRAKAAGFHKLRKLGKGEYEKEY
jgi:putative FmdB family regulatory protein